MLNVKQLISNVGFELTRRKPDILMGVGVAGIVASTVAAVCATLKVEKELEEPKKEIVEARENKDNKALTLAYLKGAGKVVKLYSPAVFGMIVSVRCCCKSNHTWKERAGIAASGLISMQNLFDEERAKVREKVGAEVEECLYYGVEDDEAPAIQMPDGKVYNHIPVVDASKLGPYARIIDETNTKVWDKTLEYTEMALRMQQDVMNRKLQENGRFFLNEAYRMVGLSDRKIGQIAGWDISNQIGDGHVDLRIKRAYVENKSFPEDSANRFKIVLLIDPNVDGDVLERMVC